MDNIENVLIDNDTAQNGSKPNKFSSWFKAVSAKVWSFIITYKYFLKNYLYFCINLKLKTFFK